MNYCIFLRNRLRYRTEISYVYSRDIWVSENIDISISTRYLIWTQNLTAGHIYSMSNSPHRYKSSIVMTYSMFNSHHQYVYKYALSILCLIVTIDMSIIITYSMFNSHHPWSIIMINNISNIHHQYVFRRIYSIYIAI